MEKIKTFFKNHLPTILFIGSLIVLSVTFFYIACPNIDINVRIDETHKTTNRY